MSFLLIKAMSPQILKVLLSEKHVLTSPNKPYFEGFSSHQPFQIFFSIWCWCAKYFFPPAMHTIFSTYCAQYIFAPPYTNIFYTTMPNIFHLMCQLSFSTYNAKYFFHLNCLTFFPPTMSNILFHIPIKYFFHLPCQSLSPEPPSNVNLPSLRHGPPPFDDFISDFLKKFIVS